MRTELQERLFDVPMGGVLPPSNESIEPISTPVPSYVLRAFGSNYGNRGDISDEGSGGVYQRQRLLDKLDFSPKNIYENVKRHPLGAGAALGGLLGGASFAGYTATSLPYALTASSAFGALGSLALGALTGGFLGLGIAGAMFYGWFRGRRRYANGKQNPQYDPKVPRSLGKWFLDWMEERNIEAEQSIPRGRG